MILGGSDGCGLAQCIDFPPAAAPERSRGDPLFNHPNGVARCQARSAARALGTKVLSRVGVPGFLAPGYSVGQARAEHAPPLRTALRRREGLALRQSINPPYQGQQACTYVLIDAMKVAKNRGAFLLEARRKRRTFSAGPRTVLRSEPSRRECVALARLARQPVPHAVSLAGRPRKQRGQSCISCDARRAPRRRTVAGSGAQRVHRSRVTGRTAPVWAAALGTAELDSCPARTVCG
jgi:hypothetical protein